MTKAVCLAMSIFGVTLLLPQTSRGEDLPLQLRYQIETKPGSERFHLLSRNEAWNPAETAIIVCDVWDLHHCLNAVRRLEEFGPRLNDVLRNARERGVTVIHSPSDCMPAYAGHPARARAVEVPAAANPPKDIALWCSRIPAEERAVYPIDQSDGGEDDDPQEHAAWAAKLKGLGRNPGMPWKKQSDMITIDPARDYISDRGDEVWNILEHRGIKNVILTGVHTNMCVIGRPFGLRQMVRGGKRVVLMRDMTDTMYNPARWPYVSHFTGTDLIISHIERYVCPTITSDQFLGGQPFRLSGDKRPHLVMVIAEEGYGTDRTLREFASRLLGKSFRVTTVFGSDADRNDIPGLEVLEQADLALFSIRRRVLKPEQMAVVRRFVDSGKPVLGIRTASHAFALRDAAPPEGYVAWPEFDAQVFGGNYHGHPEGPAQATLRAAADSDHPLLAGVPREPFSRPGSLYLTSPLAARTTVLLTGSHEGQSPEPVAWTFERKDGGKSFYTSLGERRDFEHPVFLRLLFNAVHWAAGLPVPKELPTGSRRADYERHWNSTPVPGTLAAGSGGVLKDYAGPVWYRCVVRVPAEWKGQKLTLSLPRGKDAPTAWFNGHGLASRGAGDGRLEFTIEPAAIEAGDANLIVLRTVARNGEGGLAAAPQLSNGIETIPLQGRWQFRIGDDKQWSNMPLPAKFGTATDIIFELPR